MATFAAAHQGAINFRDELLRNRWPDDRRVARSLEVSASADGRAHLAHARAARLLLGVWSEAQGRFVYPDFQFDRFGRLRPEVSELLLVLPGDDDRGGWRRAFWLYSPHALLDGLPPAEVFVSDPHRVVNVAVREFSPDYDSSW
jgi:hypothetical protein